MQRCLGHLPVQVVQKNFEITTQLAKVDIRLLLRRHYKSRFPQANVNRLHEFFSTDTFFASEKTIGGATMCQLFVGMSSNLTIPYGMIREPDSLGALQSIIRDYSTPDGIKRDNSKMQNSESWRQYEKKYLIKEITSEPHNQYHNLVE